MFRIIKKVFGKKLLGKFDVDEQVLQDFCKANQKIWNLETGKTTDSKTEKKAVLTAGAGEGYKKQTLFIGLFMVEKWMPWLEQKLLYAKGIQDKTGIRPIVTDWEYNENLEKLYASYGFGFLSLKKEMFENILGCFYGLFQAAFFFLFEGTGKQMIKKKYKGGNIGQFMYDTVIRTNQDIYTIRSARNKICFKKVFTTYWFMNSLDKVYKNYRPVCYIFDDLIYDEGMIVEYMRKRVNRVINCTMDGRMLSLDNMKGTVHWPDLDKAIMLQRLKQMSVKERAEYTKQAGAALEARFQGKNGDVRDSKAAFTGKKEGNREKLISVMGLDPQKKNVVFCAHTLSESAHRCSRQAYQDTYTWMEETMKYVRNKENANWIIKVHPVAALKYGEGCVLENLYEKYKSKNLYLFPDEYNSALVGEIADVVVTIYGNAGSEYACLGIPVILTGNAIYSGLGYTTDAFTKEEYERTLDRVEELQTLTEEQKDRAKLVFNYLSRRINQQLDRFSEKMIEINWKFDEKMMEGSSVKELNTQTMGFIKEFEKNEDMRNTNYYLNGADFEVMEKSAFIDN